MDGQLPRSEGHKYSLSSSKDFNLVPQAPQTSKPLAGNHIVSIGTKTRETKKVESLIRRLRLVA